MHRERGARDRGVRDPDEQPPHGAPDPAERPAPRTLAPDAASGAPREAPAPGPRPFLATSSPGGPPLPHPGDEPGTRSRGEHPHARPAAVPTQPAQAPAEGPPSGRSRPARPTPPQDAHRVPAQAVRAPLDRPSVRGQILAALRAALEAGELAPGEVYSAPALGERFGVSATPVREAMQRLAAEGAVETVPNRGFRVVPRTERDLAELAEIRVLIELPTVARLVRVVAPERFHELRPLAETCLRVARGGDPAAYAEADRAFHRAVLALAGNQQLVRFADDVHVRGHFPRGRGRADREADAGQHLALIDALIEGDAAAVAALVRGHFLTPA